MLTYADVIGGLSGSMTHPTGVTIGTWTLASLQVVSVYNASFQDATRACNMAAGIKTS